MKPKIISIIGGEGKMGSLFAKAFTNQGYEVLVSSEHYHNIEIAQKGDVIIFTVPINKTEEIIVKTGPYIKRDALVTDFTSVKIEPTELMISFSDSEVIGGHPLFGPTTELKNQNFILCPARGFSYLNWYANLLESCGLNIRIMSPEVHDENMAAIQCLTHLSNITYGYALKKMRFQMEIGERLSTPSYLQQLDCLENMFTGDHSLYLDIQLGNPYSRKAANCYFNSLCEIKEAIEKKDGWKLDKIIEETIKHLKKNG